MPKKGQLSKSASKRSKRQRKFNSKKSEKVRRARRNRDRARAIKAGRVKKGDGKDVHHSNRKTLSGKTSVQSQKKNRAKNSPLRRKRRRRK